MSTRVNLFFREFYSEEMEKCIRGYKLIRLLGRITLKIFKDLLDHFLLHFNYPIEAWLEERDDRGMLKNVWETPMNVHDIVLYAPV